MPIYYVAKTGNNANPGSEGLPWLTVQKAADTVIAGDTVIVSSGFYLEQPSELTSGTHDARITYLADSSLGRVVIGGFYARGAYLTVSGFEMNGSGAFALQGMIHVGIGGSNCIFTDITTSGIPNFTGVYIGGITTATPGPTGCLFNRLTLQSPNYNMISLVGTGHVVSNCFISGNAGYDAIRLQGSDITIKNNIIYNGNPFGNTASHPDFFQSFATNAAGLIQNNIIENNVCIGLNMTDGCQIGNFEDQGESGIVSNFMFRNNIFAFVDRSANVYPDYFKFYNNVFYQCAKGSNFCIIYDNIGTKGKANYVDIRNNIFFECGDAGSVSKGWYGGNAGTGLIADYNLVIGTGAGTTKNSDWTISGQEAHGINGLNPSFINAEAFNFRLSPSSACIGSGTNLSAYFTTDAAGATRTVPWDMGAYAYTTYAFKRLGRYLKLRGLAPV